MAWNWAATQIKINVMDKNRTRAQSLAKIANIFARTFSMAGNCRCPLYVSKEKADEWFDIWRLINEQRMERYERSFSGPNTGQVSLRPTIAFFRAVAERDHARARRSYLRARYINSRDSAVEVWGDDVRPVERSDDESIPADSREATRQRVGLFLPSPVQPGSSPYSPVWETPRGHSRIGIHEGTAHGTWQAAGCEYRAIWNFFFEWG